jgi:hypothetical protein
MFKIANLYKLFTHEESKFYHLHKILGFLSLGHFTMRFYHMFNNPRIDFETNYTTLGFIGIHMLLSASSNIFKIPMKRNLSLPMIWPEFRIHSIIFAYRSLLIMLGLWVTTYINIEKSYLNAYKYLITMGTLIAADYTTKYYIKNSVVDPITSTMRTMPYPPNMHPTFISILNKYYSISQVFATMVCLYTNTYTRLLLVVFPIQIAAFLMTLVRKNILSPGGWHLLYTSSLGLNYAFGLISKTEPKPIIFWISSLLFIIGRFKFNFDKYLLWSCVILIKIILEK